MLIRRVTEEEVRKGEEVMQSATPGSPARTWRHIPGRAWRLSLCDFGLARSVYAEGNGAKMLEGRPTANVVTPSFRPLELAVVSHESPHEKNYDMPKVDVFSCGAVIAELFQMMRDSDRRVGVFHPYRDAGGKPVQKELWTSREQVKMM